MEKDVTIDMLLDTFNGLSKKMTSHRFKALADHLRKHDLSLNQFSILSLIQRNGACLSIHLAQDLQLKAASITYLVDSLEKKGYVERVENPDDRRSHFVSLTEKGSELIPIPDSDFMTKEFFETLSQDDQEMMYLAMRFIAKKIEI